MKIGGGTEFDADVLKLRPKFDGFNVESLRDCSIRQEMNRRSTLSKCGEVVEEIAPVNYLSGVRVIAVSRMSRIAT